MCVDVELFALDPDSERAGVTDLRHDLYLNLAGTNRKGIRQSEDHLNKISIRDGSEILCGNIIDLIISTRQINYNRIGRCALCQRKIPYKDHHSCVAIEQPRREEITGIYDRERISQQ